MESSSAVVLPGAVVFQYSKSSIAHFSSIYVMLLKMVPGNCIVNCQDQNSEGKRKSNEQSLWGSFETYFWVARLGNGLFTIIFGILINGLYRPLNMSK